MSSYELNIACGDTLVITLNSEMSYSALKQMQRHFEDVFRDQQIKIMVLSGGADVTLIKSSNLDDNTDANLRKNNPAMQDAWEKYVLVKNLSVMDKDALE